MMITPACNSPAHEEQENGTIVGYKRIVFLADGGHELPVRNRDAPLA
jgi:hypothetical protein